jgi:hypothetical protein
LLAKCSDGDCSGAGSHTKVNGWGPFFANDRFVALLQKLIDSQLKSFRGSGPGAAIIIQNAPRSTHAQSNSKGKRPSIRSAHGCFYLQYA